MAGTGGGGGMSALGALAASSAPGVNVAIPKKFSFGGLARKRSDQNGPNNGDCANPHAINNGAGASVSRTEAESWARSFENLVRNEHGLCLFRLFLQREFSEENIDFWSAVRDFKRFAAELGDNPGDNPGDGDGDGATELARRAHAIHDEFVMVQAPKEVNLDADTRSATEASLRRPHANMFDCALVKIEHLMEKDSFPRFLKSDLYLDLLVQCKK